MTGAAPTTSEPVGGAKALRVAIAGASGRMGRMLVEAVLASDDLRLAGALDVSSSPAIGQDAGAFLGKHTGVMVLEIGRAHV